MYYYKFRIYLPNKNCVSTLIHLLKTQFINKRIIIKQMEYPEEVVQISVRKKEEKKEIFDFLDENVFFKNIDIHLQDKHKTFK